jgi:hypothetical protein
MNRLLTLMILVAPALLAQDPAATAPEPVTLSDLEKLERRYEEQLAERQPFAASNAGSMQEFKKPCSIDTKVRYEVGNSIAGFEKAKTGFDAARVRIQKSAPPQVLLDP